MPTVNTIKIEADHYYDINNHVHIHIWSKGLEGGARSAIYTNLLVTMSHALYPMLPYVTVVAKEHGISAALYATEQEARDEHDRCMKWGSKTVWSGSLPDLMSSKEGAVKEG